MVHRDLVKEIYLLCTCFSLSLGVEEQVDHSLKAKSFLGNEHPGLYLYGFSSWLHPDSFCYSDHK